jgi:hypothetical protein
MPPHQILAFHSGARRVSREEVPETIRAASERDAPAEWLRLDVPAELTAQLQMGVEHDLLVGVAVLAGDHYLALSVEKLNEITATGPLLIPATIRDGGGPGQPFEIRLDPPPEARATKRPRPTLEKTPKD